MENINDYSFKPVLNPDWFLFSSNWDVTEILDIDDSLGMCWAKISSVLDKKNDDWEKLVELGFHEFNLNMFINTLILFNYKYKTCRSNNIKLMLEMINSGRIPHEQFIEYLRSVRGMLEREVSKLAISVADDISMSGLLFVVNETNSTIHFKSKAIPVFYSTSYDEISMFSFTSLPDMNLYLNYSNVANFTGEDCAVKFKKFVKDKSVLFDKSNSMVIYTLPRFDMKKAAGLFYATYLFNAWANESEFNPHIIEDVISKIDGNETCLAFTPEV